MAKGPEVESMPAETSTYRGGEKIQTKEVGFIRRHRGAMALGATALILVGGYYTKKGYDAVTNERYAANDCSDMTHAQADISSGWRSGFARKLNGRWNGGSLADFANHVSEQRQYYINPETVKEQNPQYAQFADANLKPGVYCLSIPAPQVDTTYGPTMVMRERPDNLQTLVAGSDGKPDQNMVKAVAGANAQAWVASNFEGLPDTGLYPIDNDFVSWINEEPGITLDAINRTKQQAQEMGLLGN